MSKPLTIEQLKALEVGDWVYIKSSTRQGYYNFREFNKSLFVCKYDKANSFNVFKMSDYGKFWLAYKNKEEAEGEYDSRVEQAKKQTAKEIFDKLKEDIVTGCEETGSGLSIYDCGWAYMSCVLWTSIVEIAKNYGIELKDVDE